MNSIKQVVIVHYSVPPVVGGVEFVIEPMAELFAKNGWYVSVLAGKGKLNSKNIKTTLIPELYGENSSVKNTQSMLTVGSLPDNYESSVKNLEKKIETQIGNINTVIIHNMMTMPFNLLATEAFFNYINNNPHKNFYVWIHDLAWLMEDHNSYLFERKPWSILKTAQKNVKYFTISKYRKKQAMTLMKLSAKQLKVVPNGIDFSKFLNLNEATIKLVGQLNFSQNRPLITIPARLINRKNLERTIYILAELKQYAPNLLAIIAGSPVQGNNVSENYYTKLNSLIKKLSAENNIKFLFEFGGKAGFSEQENREIVHDLYFISDFTMLLSKDEGFGLPLLEGGLARQPLVLSDLDVFHEIAGDKALFIPEFEPPEIAAKTIKKAFLDSPTKIQNLFSEVLQNYSWDAIWENYLSEEFSI